MCSAVVGAVEYEALSCLLTVHLSTLALRAHICPGFAAAGTVGSDLADQMVSGTGRRLLLLPPTFTSNPTHPVSRLQRVIIMSTYQAIHAGADVSTHASWTR